MMLVNMLPHAPSNSPIDCGFRDTVINTKLSIGDFASGVLGSKLSHNLWGQSGMLTTLRNLVHDIVDFGSQEKMVWPDTSRIVTAMKDPHAIRDRSVGQFPRHAMRVLVALFSRSVGKHAVASPITSACPLPASIWTACIDMFPESLLKRDGLILVSCNSDASTGAVFSIPACYSTRGYTERCSTNLTGTLDGHSGFLSRTWGATPTAVSAARRLFDVSILPSTSRNMIEKGV